MVSAPVAAAPIAAAVPLSANVVEPSSAKVGANPSATTSDRPAVVDNLLANEHRVVQMIAAIRAGGLREVAQTSDLSPNLEQRLDEFFASTSWTRRVNRRDK